MGIQENVSVYYDVIFNLIHNQIEKYDSWIFKKYNQDEIRIKSIATTIILVPLKYLNHHFHENVL